MLDVMEYPRVAFFDAVARSKEALLVRGLVPEAVEVRFGQGALEDVRPEALKALASMSKVLGLPLRFPEEQGFRPLLVDITVRCENDEGATHRAFIHPKEL